MYDDGIILDDKAHSIYCEYAKNRLYYPEIPRETIQAESKGIAMWSYYVADRFRNPSAHVERMEKCKVQECWEFIITVDHIIEKILKNMK